MGKPDMPEHTQEKHHDQIAASMDTSNSFWDIKLHGSWSPSVFCKKITRFLESDRALSKFKW